MADNHAILCYCEDHGIYEVYKQTPHTITYYSYFGKEGFYRVTKNVVTGREVRKHLRYKTTPRFLKTPKGVRYNYFTG